MGGRLSSLTQTNNQNPQAALLGACQRAHGCQGRLRAGYAGGLAAILDSRSARWPWGEQVGSEEQV